MSIQNELDKIKNAVYGREVRGAIHDGIKKAYDDASEKDNANMEVKLARGNYKTLNNRLSAFDDSHKKADLKINSKADDKKMSKLEGDLQSYHDRIDNIIAQPTSVSEQEIIDARQGKASLGANIRSIKDGITERIAQELDSDYILRRLPGGARDSFTSDGIIKETKRILLNGGEGWSGSMVGSYYNLRLIIPDIKSGITEMHTLTHGEEVYPFSYSLDENRHFYVYSDVRGLELRVFIEKSLIDNYSGENFVERFENYIQATGNVFEFTYTLQNPTLLPFPKKMTANTEWLVELHKKIDGLSLENGNSNNRPLIDEVTGKEYYWSIGINDGVPSINLTEKSEG